jgi:hypothetical protein
MSASDLPELYAWQCFRARTECISSKDLNRKVFLGSLALRPMREALNAEARSSSFLWMASLFGAYAFRRSLEHGDPK